MHYTSLYHCMCILIRLNRLQQSYNVSYEKNGLRENIIDMRFILSPHETEKQYSQESITTDFSHQVSELLHILITNKITSSQVMKMRTSFRCAFLLTLITNVKFSI